VATVNTIGTSGRDYSTLQAWEDAIPATPTGGYEGHCYNDSQFTAALRIDGHTTSAANYILLTAAAGQSFQDHASVRTNPLIFDATKGVSVAANPGGATTLVYVNNNHSRVSRMQIRRTGVSYGAHVLEFAAGHLQGEIKDCIIHKQGSSTATAVAIRSSTAINLLIYDTGATATNSALSLSNAGTGGGTAINCTVVRSGATGGTGITAAYSGNNVRNCAVFGFTTAFGGSGSFSSSPSSGYNATDAASAPGSNNQTSKTYANQFVSTTVDYQLKTGSDCINTGNTEASAANDITATVRGTTTAGDIGAWEFVAAAAGQAHLLTGLLMGLLRGKFG
jgi:hypothetical protein